MIPNRFDDYTNEPEYNTVDASLWFIHAAFEYARLSGKDRRERLRKLLPPRVSSIYIDRVSARAPGTHIPHGPRRRAYQRRAIAKTQLTWMDAKCGDIAFTPRQGKPVEINALWYHALRADGRNRTGKKSGRWVSSAAFWLDDDPGAGGRVGRRPGSDAAASAESNLRRQFAQQRRCRPINSRRRW